MAPEIKEVTITEPVPSILNVDESKEEKSKEESESKDSSETRKIINI